MLSPRWERLGIWLVVDVIYTGGDEIILYLLMLDRDWPVEKCDGVGFD